jgi:hypothetical protein
MEQSIRRLTAIATALSDNLYNDLARVEISEDTTLETLKLIVIPHDGIHKGIRYIVTCKFQEHGNWPLVYIDSEIYDKIKTTQYMQNKGANGDHKGICIKNLGYGYNYKYFKELCGNKWENYVYYLIVFFNNIQDFEKGNGLKSNYKEILQI